MISVHYHERLNEVQGDAQLAALLADEDATAPFVRGEWFSLLAEHCGLRPLLAVASNGEARVVLPLRRVGDRLEALATWYTFVVKPLLTADAMGPAMLRAIARGLKGKTWRVTIAPLADEDGSALLLQDAFRSTGWFVRRSQSDVNHVLEVGDRDFAAYLASRPGELRSTLKRKAKKVDVRMFRSFSEEAWNDYRAVYAASWKPSEGSPAFLQAFARAEGSAGRLRMAVAYADGRPVAAQFWTVEGGTAFIHKLAHIEEAKPLSAGTTLSARLFEEVIDRDKVRLVDFGTGDDPYKRSWMEKVRPRFAIDCLNRSHPRAWPHIAWAALRHLAGRD